MPPVWAVRRLDNGVIRLALQPGHEEHARRRELGEPLEVDVPLSNTRIVPGVNVCCARSSLVMLAV